MNTSYGEGYENIVRLSDAYWSMEILSVHTQSILILSSYLILQQQSAHSHTNELLHIHTDTGFVDCSFLFEEIYESIDHPTLD
jgi:hypothetical protein